MTDEQHAALEQLRNEPDDGERFQRSTPWIIATGVVILLAVFIGFGYLAIRTNTIAGQGADTSKALKTLLTNGKTTSAISAKKTEVLAEEIKALIQGGKSAGAEQSKRAAEAAAQGLVILHQAESLIGSEIAANHSSGLVTRQILCAGAMDAHPNDLTIRRLCAS